MSLRGYRVYPCKACGKRRRHTVVSEIVVGVEAIRTLRCSKGHETIRKIVGLHALTQIFKDIVTPQISAHLNSAFPLKEYFRR